MGLQRGGKHDGGACPGEGGAAAAAAAASLVVQATNPSAAAHIGRIFYQVIASQGLPAGQRGVWTSVALHPACDGTRAPFRGCAERRISAAPTNERRTGARVLWRAVMRCLPTRPQHGNSRGPATGRLAFAFKPGAYSYARPRRRQALSVTRPAGAQHGGWTARCRRPKPSM